MNQYTFFNIQEFFNPFPRLERLLNPFRPYCVTQYSGHRLAIHMTKRGKRALQKHEQKLFIELQLMYSCIPKKRVLFHDHKEYSFESVDDSIAICFRAVQPEACDPEEFATYYPEKNEVKKILIPSRLFLDFKGTKWDGSFEF